jgi:hypothetical protein
MHFDMPWSRDLPATVVVSRVMPSVFVDLDGRPLVTLELHESHLHRCCSHGRVRRRQRGSARFRGSTHGGDASDAGRNAIAIHSGRSNATAVADSRHARG